MKVTVSGNEVHVATGGRAHVDGRPFLVFLHGAGNCHLTWVSQTRALAYDGYNVIAPDMPGHYLSKGEPISGVEAQADWVIALLREMGCKQAVFAGHSQGGIITLEIARKAPDLVKAIVFVATAASIAVNDKLIDMAENKQFRAIESMTSWGHGPQAHLHDNTWPGASHIFYGLDVMELNQKEALPADLKSCRSYSSGLEVAAKIHCPTLCIFAENDKMTQLRYGKLLAAALPDNEMHILPKAGHMLPNERPREVNELLRRFLGRLDTQKAA